jgi:hypothetical protein
MDDVSGQEGGSMMTSKFSSSVETHSMHLVARCLSLQLLNHLHHGGGGLVLAPDSSHLADLGELIIQRHEVKLPLASRLASRVGADISMQPPKGTGSILVMRVRVLDDHLAHVAGGTVGKPAGVNQLQVLGGEIDVLDDLLPDHGGQRLVTHMKQAVVKN